MNLTFKLVFDESADDQYGFYRHYRKTIRRTYQDFSKRPTIDFFKILNNTFVLHVSRIIIDYRKCLHPVQILFF